MSGLWRRYRRLPRNVFAIGLVSLLNDASSEIIYPLLPLYLSVSLGASPIAIGAIEGAAESVSSLVKLAAGYLSDRLGRRKELVVAGYFLASVARTLLAATSTWSQVLGLRVVDRVGKGVRSAPRDAMIADSVGAHERGVAFGLHRAMDHAGAVLGPLLGLGILLFVATDSATPTAGEYQLVFLLAAIPAVGSVCVAAFVLKEPPSTLALRAVARRSARLSLSGFDSNFKRYLFIIALFTLSNSSDAFLLLRANELGVSAATIPLLWAALHVSKVLSSFIGGDMADRYGKKRVIGVGWLLYAAVYAGFAFAQTPGAIWGLMIVYGLYFGMAEGAEKALVADLVQPDQRGTAFGLYNLAFSITVLPASLLMGGMWKLAGAETAFLVSSGVGVLAAALLVFVRPRTTRAARPTESAKPSVHGVASSTVQLPVDRPHEEGVRGSDRASD